MNERGIPTESSVNADIGRPSARSDTLASGAFGSGDEAFLNECRRHLNDNLVRMITTLIQKFRPLHPGTMIEGQARKWVNHPANFVAITIQNHHQSFAVCVKGRPNDFAAPTLHIKTDRTPYSRFKLRHEGQLQDAIKVVLTSAARDNGYSP